MHVFWKNYPWNLRHQMLIDGCAVLGVLVAIGCSSSILLKEKYDSILCYGIHFFHAKYDLWVHVVPGFIYSLVNWIIHKLAWLKLVVEHVAVHEFQLNPGLSDVRSYKGRRGLQTNGLNRLPLHLAKGKRLETSSIFNGNLTQEWKMRIIIKSTSSFNAVHDVFKRTFLLEIVWAVFINDLAKFTAISTNLKRN